MSDKSARMAAHKAMRPGRRDGAIAFCAAGGAAACPAGAGGILWSLVVLIGIVGLSPLSGGAAARETLAARRARRARIAAAPSAIWARQARRNTAPADRVHPFRLSADRCQSAQ